MIGEYSLELHYNNLCNYTTITFIYLRESEKFIVKF